MMIVPSWPTYPELHHSARSARTQSEDESPPAIEPIAPIAIADAGDAHHAAAARRVNKTILPQVDSNMGIRSTLGIEKDQVTRFQGTRGNRNSLAANAVAIPGESESSRLPVDPPDEAAAVEARIG